MVLSFRRLLSRSSFIEELESYSRELIIPVTLNAWVVQEVLVKLLLPISIVLTKLQSVIKAQIKKQSSFGLFGGPKTTGPVVTSSSKATALLSYGYVCMLTPIELITSRVEVHIVNNVLMMFGVVAAFLLKDAFLRIKNVEITKTTRGIEEVREFQK